MNNLGIKSLVDTVRNTYWLVSRFGTGQLSNLHLSATLKDDGATKAALDKPKRPINAYIRYVQSVRASLSKANPTVPSKDISKMAAVKWQTLDPASKLKFEEEYKREQAVWIQKNAKYLSTLTNERKEEIKQERQQKQEEKAKREQRRLMKELGRPKRPLNGFLRYAQNKPIGGLSKDENKEQMKKLGHEWQNLPAAEKDRYNKEAAADMKRYQDEMKQWEAKMLASDNGEALRKKNILLPPSPAASSRAKGSSTSRTPAPKPTANRP